MEIKKIMSILPHRYPFLLVDRIIELEPGKKAVGIKNVTVNEPQFSGHFPGEPIMPGVLLIEAVAQVGACALMSQKEYENCLPILAGVDRFRFKRQVVPGDVLTISSQLQNIKGDIGRGKGIITTGDQTVCGGEFWFALQKRQG